MTTPEDLRHFHSEDYDQFQMIPPHTAGWIMLAAVALAAILEPLVR